MPLAVGLGDLELPWSLVVFTAAAYPIVLIGPFCTRSLLQFLHPRIQRYLAEGDLGSRRSSADREDEAAV